MTNVSQLIIDTEPSDPPTAADAFLAMQKQKKNRKVYRTRRHFAEQAVYLFEKKGFSATTIDEISTLADYSTSTFFRHFSDKEEVLFFDYYDRMEEFQSIFGSPNHSDPWLAVQSTFIVFAKIWDGDADKLGIRRFRLIHREPVLYNRFLAKAADWEVLMSDMLKQHFTDTASAELVSSVIAGAASAAFRAGCKVKVKSRKKTLSLAKCVEDAFQALEHLGRLTEGAT
ncbi:TetR/AcrR family transcriptional regulator [Zhongshania marina]|uniref:TetR/AcrR family transcriptional regulator n=1 Tax=Zhongshania marina TaxID=2304603 RepID=A0ABX9W5E3_9GAMM|nr:TetR/AcrR family transcriptional regulator [Zhongshania marina]